MDTKGLIKNLVEKHKYKKLSPGESEFARTRFKHDLPSFLKDKIDGSDMKLFIKSRLDNSDLVCDGFERIVIGDYGAYIEFSEHQKAKTLVPMKGQEWRLEPKYSNAKYHAYTTPAYSGVTLNEGAPLIYKQTKLVDYADYKIGMYYISVYDVWPAISENDYAASYVASVSCIERRKFYDSHWRIEEKITENAGKPLIVKRLDTEDANHLLSLVEECLAEDNNLEDLSETSIYYD